MIYEIGKVNYLGNRSSNQDRFAISEKDDEILIVLADGMGGYKGGTFAADTIVLKFIETFRKTKHPIKNPDDFFRDAFLTSHETIVTLGKKHKSSEQARSTAVVCLVQNNHVWFSHIGDSRFYLFRYGKVHIRTRDHSQVEELLQQGKINEKQFKTHPQRNKVTRCLGGAFIPPKIELGEKIELEPDDVIFLCSDGLWNPVSDDEIGITLVDEKKIVVAVDKLAQQAEKASYPNCDNVTAVGLRWISNEQPVKKPDIMLAAKEQKTKLKNKNPDQKVILDVLDEIDRALKKTEEDMKKY